MNHLIAPRGIQNVQGQSYTSDVKVALMHLLDRPLVLGIVAAVQELRD